MRLRDISRALRAAADVARVGEQLIISLDRSRGSAGSILIGVGLGVGLGALLFSDTARERVRTWINGAIAVKPSDAEQENAVSAPH